MKPSNASSQEGTRLNKYISENGICSRREADQQIELGNVFINGERAKIGQRVKSGDKVSVNGIKISPKTEDNSIFIAFNKPVGITCTTEKGVEESISRYINYKQRIFPIGRLDKDSQGLIFLTNNGDIVNKILRAGNHHEKEYVVTVNKPVTEAFIRAMGNGVPMLGVVTQKCPVSAEGPMSFRITLIQGMNRQIRRMCEYFDYEVIKLERVRIMNISLKGIPQGEWRELSREESHELNAMLEKSVSTEEASARPPSKNRPKGKKVAASTEQRAKKKWSQHRSKDSTHAKRNSGGKQRKKKR